MGPQFGAVVTDESADAGQYVTDRLRVESASVSQAQCDVIVSGLLGADDGLVGNQAGLPDSGAQAAAVRSRDLGTQPESGRSVGRGLRRSAVRCRRSGGSPAGWGRARRGRRRRAAR